jgi:hypothetical protein
VLFCWHGPPYWLPPQAPWSSQPTSFQHDSTTSRTAASTPPCLPGYGMDHVRLRRQPDATVFSSPKCLGRPMLQDQADICSTLPLNPSIELACSPHVLQVPVSGFRPFHCPVSNVKCNLILTCKCQINEADAQGENDLDRLEAEEMGF